MHSICKVYVVKTTSLNPVNGNLVFRVLKPLQAVIYPEFEYICHLGPYFRKKEAINSFHRELIQLLFHCHQISLTLFINTKSCQSWKYMYGFWSIVVSLWLEIQGNWHKINSPAIKGYNPMRLQKLKEEAVISIFYHTNEWLWWNLHKIKSRKWRSANQ